MKLLILISPYPPHHIGGYELRCCQVVDDLRRRGHQVEVITSRCPQPGCSLHRAEKMIARVLHSRNGPRVTLRQVSYDLLDLRYISSRLRAFDPDIVFVWHIQDLSHAIFPYLAGQRRQIVIDDGSAETRFLYRLLRSGLYFYRNDKDLVLKRWLKASGHLMANLFSLNLIRPWWSWPQNLRICFTSAASLQFAREDGAPVDEAQVMHSGIDLSHFPYVSRSGLGSPIKILVPGRIHPQKGTADAVSLAYELRKSGHAVQLLLVGGIQSPDYLDEIIFTARDLGLGDVVKYQTMISQADLARLYQEYDVCFFPSYYRHGLSRVPLEAMASGCLVVSYGNEGSSEIIQDHETGLLVPEGDFASAAALIAGLEKSPNELKRITQSARAQIEREHTLEAYIDNIEAYLRECVLNGSPARSQGMAVHASLR